MSTGKEDAGGPCVWLPTRGEGLAGASLTGLGCIADQALRLQLGSEPMLTFQGRREGDFSFDLSDCVRRKSKCSGG